MKEREGDFEEEKTPRENNVMTGFKCSLSREICFLCKSIVPYESKPDLVNFPIHIPFRRKMLCLHRSYRRKILHEESTVKIEMIDGSSAKVQWTEIRIQWILTRLFSLNRVLTIITKKEK